MNYIIETKKLIKQYSTQIAVDNVDMHVKKGEIYGLLGRNGAGKTTVMRMLLNLATPTSGEIILFGQRLKGNKSEIYHRIGSIIETPGFYENLTASENLNLLIRIRGTHKKAREAVHHALELVRLEHETKKIVKHYSLGMKQRLGIAAAVLHSPDLLILDEPINGLDPEGIHEIRNFFLELKKNGTTILISSHILSEIELIADTIAVMHQGKLLEEVSIAELNQKNRKFVEFDVSDDSKASVCLERYFAGIEYSVTENNTLRIYSNFDKRGEINNAFVTAGITVSGIILAKEKLESYFSAVIGGDIHV